MRGRIKAMLVLAALASGCAERPADAAGEARGKEAPAMDQRTNGTDGVSGLPSSFGRSFATLDDYLEHLRRYAATVDQPWYRKVGPDVFEYVTTTNPAPPRKTFTRDELMRKFGFTR